MNMKTWVHLIMIAALACGLSACGTRGKLKSPTQIQASEAKKASKKAKSGQDSEVEDTTGEDPEVQAPPTSAGESPHVMPPTENK